MAFSDADGHSLTTWTYDGATDQWSWRMDNEQSGRRQEFARLSMRRKTLTITPELAASFPRYAAR